QRRFRLAPDIFRALVIAQAEIDRLAEISLVGPFAEFDLRHELRLRPVRTLVRPRTFLERALRRLERLSEMDAALQLLESRGLAVLVERHNLAVEHDRAFQFFGVAGERS